MSENDNSAPMADEPVATDNSQALDTSVADSQNNETPEATPAVEGKETAEIKATENVKEELLLGKFKSAEDLAKAYTELESQYGRTNSEKVELSRILNEAFETPAPQMQQPQDYEYSQEEPNSKEDARDRDIALLKFSIAHQNANGDAMVKVLRDDPFIKNITSYDAKLEYAYLKSQNMTQPKAIEEARKKTAEQTQAKIAEKQSAQVEAARTQAPPVDSNNELTPSEIRSTIRDDKAFDELIKKRFPGISKMRGR